MSTDAPPRVTPSLLEDEVLVLLRRVRSILREQARAVHPDLQPAPYLMLSWLVEQGPVRATRIVEAFDIDKAAVSRQLTSLHRMGLVRRRLDPSDRRGRLVVASDEALRRMARHSSRRATWLTERLEDWSAAEAEALLSQIARLNVALED